MYLNRLARSRILNTLLSLLVITLLSACGTSATAHSVHPETPQASVTANKLTSTPDPSHTSSDVYNIDTTTLNESNITENIGNLLIQSTEGFQCPYGFQARNAVFPLDQLVLASDRTTYSQDEIQQMRAYLQVANRSNGYENFNAANFLASGSEPPPTLRWVSAGSVDPIPGDMHGGKDVACGAALNLTNTGNTPIQIPMVGVQLQEPLYRDSYQYRLIEPCSLLPPPNEYCGPSFGGQGDCATYTALIQLGLEGTNDVFSGVPSAPGCNTLTITPTAQVTLVFEFTLAANTPKNLVYSVLPTLTVDTAQGEQTLSLSQLRSMLTFASGNQFSCYELQGTTFVLLQPPINYPQWCI